MGGEFFQQADETLLVHVGRGLDVLCADGDTICCVGGETCAEHNERAVQSCLPASLVTVFSALRAVTKPDSHGASNNTAAAAATLVSRAANYTSLAWLLCLQAINKYGVAHLAVKQRLLQQYRCYGITLIL